MARQQIWWLFQPNRATWYCYQSLKPGHVSGNMAVGSLPGSTKPTRKGRNAEITEASKCIRTPKISKESVWQIWDALCIYNIKYILIYDTYVSKEVLLVLLRNFAVLPPRIPDSCNIWSHPCSFLQGCKLEAKKTRVRPWKPRNVTTKPKTHISNHNIRKSFRKN